MNSRRKPLLVLAVVLGFVVPSFAQRHHDPLNSKEVNELRDAAQDPPKRMKLFISFAKARMEMIEHMRTDPKPAAEGPGIDQLLSDVADLMDEIDDNLDMFDRRSQDLRRPLKGIIEMCSDFQLKLRTMKETSTPEQLRAYGVSLEDATDSVNESADSARAMLADQVSKRGEARDNPKEAKEEKKKDKKKSDDDDDSQPKPPCSPC
jgi:hypothetical protein